MIGRREFVAGLGCLPALLGFVNSKPKENGWISVEDRLPELEHRAFTDGDRVSDTVVTMRRPGCPCLRQLYKTSSGRVTWNGLGEHSAQPTHWIELPEPPPKEEMVNLNHRALMGWTGGKPVPPIEWRGSLAESFERALTHFSSTVSQRT